MMKRISIAMEGPARAWCKLMHRNPMWPVRGFYRCRQCLRQYPVPWELRQLPAPATEIKVKELRPEVASLRPAALAASRAAAS
jgi:hypothetical protein